MTGWRLGYAVAAEPWMTGLKRRRFTLRMECQLQPMGWACSDAT